MDTLGWIKLQHRDLGGALPLLRHAHDLKPNDPEIGYHLAVALDATGKRADAKELLKGVLVKNPKFDDALEAQQLMARW
jgi:Flp pilus assembly protein TadD